MNRAHRSLPFLVACFAAACSDGAMDERVPPPRLALAVNTTVVAPDARAPVPAVDLARLGSPSIGAVYRLTTPPDTPLCFDLVNWSESAQGTATVSLVHAADGGAVPAGGPETLARAGLVPSGSGLTGAEQWISANGDGLARLTVQGSIRAPQVLVVTSTEGSAAIVSIELGERSIVNQVERPVPAHPAVASRQTIYSSDAWNFGLPVVATSGDRTSIVAYEGDRARGMSFARYEMRMQHDRASGAVTGGGSVQASPDLGNWRDHEIAALYNVLAVVRSERDGARLLLSFDRGASFAQELLFGQGPGPVRVAQLGMAGDYTLAITWWQTANSGALEFHLVEGRPVAFDQHGSPSWYGFDPVRVLHSMPADSSPLTTGIAWSEGGDLVIGYAASHWTVATAGWASTTEFRCATRRWGQELRQVLVDSETVFGRDPSVAVRGSGAGLRIFYAYEVQDGIRLATSGDGGASFTPGPTFGGAGAHLPSAFVRPRGAATQVDVLYLASAVNGTELHHSRWSDWPTSAREDYRITAAWIGPTPAQGPRTGGNGTTPPIDFGLRTTQVSWLGYDAVLDGDQIVAVVDEVTFDAAFLCLGLFSLARGPQAWTTGGWLWPTYSSAQPPPLAPGMTQALPAVDPAHCHQLQIVRID